MLRNARIQPSFLYLAYKARFVVPPFYFILFYFIFGRTMLSRLFASWNLPMCLADAGSLFSWAGSHCFNLFPFNWREIIESFQSLPLLPPTYACIVPFSRPVLLCIIDFILCTDKRFNTSHRITRWVLSDIRSQSTQTSSYERNTYRK